jgi:hypothetical protein
MLRRVRETRTVELLRASGEEVRAKVESGDWTINRARQEMGLPALGPAGDETAQRRPDDLPGAMAWYDLGLPDGLEYQLEAPEPGYTERFEPYDMRDMQALLERPLMPRPITNRLSPAGLSFTDQHFNPSLLTPDAKRTPPWSRWTTRQNLAAFAVFIGLALIPLLVGLFAH